MASKRRRSTGWCLVATVNRNENARSSSVGSLQVGVNIWTFSMEVCMRSAVSRFLRSLISARVICKKFRKKIHMSGT